MAFVDMIAAYGHGLSGLAAAAAQQTYCLDSNGRLTDCTAKPCTATQDSGCVAYTGTAPVGSICTDISGAITECGSSGALGASSASGSLFSGISTTTLAIGGIAAFAVLLMVMRR